MKEINELKVERDNWKALALWLADCHASQVEDEIEKLDKTLQKSRAASVLRMITEVLPKITTTDKIDIIRSHYNTRTVEDIIERCNTCTRTIIDEA